jgi:phosphoribosylformimino-5-aminoimidazole carboxamide ribotide isomerase
MILYPAIDLKSGKCVRLLQGDFDKIIYYDNDPVKTAQKYAEEGAEYLHVIDLDGAKAGYLKQENLIREIQHQTGLKIQTGGGVRHKNDLDFLFNHQISRVIIGSLAVTQPQLVKDWLVEFGAERIVLAFDVRFINNIPIVVVNGWQNISQKTLWELLEIYQDFSIKHILCTDISLDGALKGVNLNLYESCHQQYPDIHFQASGGVTCLEDLQALKQIPISGAIIGKALYEKRFSLTEAIDRIRTC